MAAPHPTDPEPFGNIPPELAASPDYEIIRELGKGGMGVVYLARNKMMDRLEVLKVLNKNLLHKQGMLDRFLREIRSAARLAHPNVVGAYTALQMGGFVVFVMEYVEGHDLSVLVKKNGPLSIVNACYYTYQAALGLQHAHEKGMVHRDIKPSNLILARQGKKHVVKVLDFGLAKATSENPLDAGLTSEGQMLGTPDYIAPEQALSSVSADIRSDIYSLGCSLYYLLAAKPPFQGTNLMQILYAHKHGPIPLLDEVPAPLAAVIARMMAKEPAERFQKPSEVAQALTSFFRRGPTTDVTPRTFPADSPPADRSKTGQWWDGQLFAETTDHPKPKEKPASSKKIWLSLAAVAVLVLTLVTSGAFRQKAVDVEPFREPIATVNKESGKANPMIDPPLALAKRKPGEVVEVEIGKGVKMKFCWIPAGEAQLGSPLAERVEVLKQFKEKKEPEWLQAEAEGARGKFKTKGFWLGKYTVTQEEWLAVMGGENPSFFSSEGGGKTQVDTNTDRYPVEQVSWEDIAKDDGFLKKFNEKAKVPAALGPGKFVLPHEDQWEYACRGGKGNKQAFYFGDMLKGDKANHNGDYPYGTETKGTYLVQTTKVGSYEEIAPHPWGLCDMSGNVWQWCENISSGSNRALRGGSWFADGGSCRSAIRYGQRSSWLYSRGTNGFRLARVPSEQ